MKLPIARYKRNVEGFRCPLCNSVIKWTCGIGEGTVGYAYCTKSIEASQTFSKDAIKSKRAFCAWKGKVQRNKDRIMVVECTKEGKD